MNNSNNTAAAGIAKLIDGYALHTFEAVKDADRESMATHTMIMGLSCLAGMISSYENVLGHSSQQARDLYDAVAKSCVGIINHRMEHEEGYSVPATTAEEEDHKAMAKLAVDFLCERPDMYPTSNN